MLPLHTLPSRQRGAFNLYWVAIASVVFAAVAMAALMSIRSERNLFAEGVDKLGKTVTDSPAGAVIDSARQAARGEQGTLRKCTINGKVVVEANLDEWSEAQKNPDGSKNKFKTALKDLPRTGHIGLQYHGHPVWFRNVRVKGM